MRILWHPSEIQKVLDLDLQPENSITGVTFDSRNVQKGNLFIAFKGPIKDGYDFVNDAFAAGAAHALVERPHPHPHALLVKDSFKALETLAQQARKRSTGRILGITGSFGKTTAKECAAHILGSLYPITATQRSFNNHWGVPLSVASLNQDDAFGIFEMGMNHAGELANLTQYVKPHVALITTIAGAHVGNFDSLHDIAQAKSEIFLGMSPKESAVLPHDNPYYPFLCDQAQKYDLTIISFGENPLSTLRLVEFKHIEEGLSVTFKCEGKTYTYTLHAYGEHLIQTTLGVMAALYALGVELETSCQLMASFHLLPGRGQLITLPWENGFVTLMDESYNAGPESMAYALQAFARLPQKDGKKWVALGDMLELGSLSEKAHQALLPSVMSDAISGAFLYGPEMKALYNMLPAAHNYGHFDTFEDLSQNLISHLKPGDSVLVKGSRGRRAFEGRMAQVIDYLKEYSQKQTPLSP